MFFSTAVLVLTASAMVYYYLTRNFRHWKKLGVNGPRPQFVVGNYASMALQNRHVIYDLDDIYRKYKKDEDFVGIYSGANPQLLITSPTLAHRIYVDYFSNFHDNEASQIFDKKCDFLFTLTGQEWKEKRAELNPGLSLGRVKAAYLVTNKICKRMTKYLKEQAKLPPRDGLNGKDLARHPKIQQNLRSEIERHVYKNEAMDFDTLVQLPYLDACIHEAIRFFPPGYFSNKICTEPIKLVNKNGHVLQVQKGDVIVLPLYSLMMDEDYYPNAQEFQPRRFMPKNGGVRKYLESGVYFGFGQGPRVCLGATFALAQTKAAIVEILRNFYVRVNPKTRKDNNWDPKTFQMQLNGGIWLDFEARN